jgi:protein SCO1/2
VTDRPFRVIASVAKQSIFLVLFLLTACHKDLVSHQDVATTGLVPPLSLAMQDVTTNAPVTAQSFAGKTVLLYFGYANCPDVCPASLYNVDKILRKLGPAASNIVFLFVTVDPDRDSPAALAQYTALFGPSIHGLRGTPDQLYALARRYRVVFSVTKTPTYSVTHSAAVYVFNGQGQSQFLIAGLDTANPDIAGITEDLRNSITASRENPLVAWLENLTSS